MDASKLFKVLVLGGAMIGAACVESRPAPEPGEVDDAAVARADSGGEGVDSGGAGGGDAGGGGEGVECGFCPSEACCEPDGAGGSRNRPGLVCCWSTSC